MARTVRAHVPDEVGDIASALSGSASGGAGSALAAAWAQSYTAWATQAEAHAQSMREAAGDWDGVDEHAAGAFGQFPMTPTGPAAWPGASGPTSSPAKLGRFTAGGMEAV
ncbi:hypothetical protein [Actinotalea fermentans]|uniref:hypothetical protein n=1 Tax=Actinotalea fermentans TaxID=43671 RepID=UPI00051F34D0|nr:hypothetical protein [Actinotalea fermentans]KGM15832.1 hypothetical protein N867_05130 [Actinotalea fermentans ATCC 43279 = JCM 9966 = DSM 3133]